VHKFDGCPTVEKRLPLCIPGTDKLLVLLGPFPHELTEWVEANTRQMDITEEEYAIDAGIFRMHLHGGLLVGTDLGRALAF